MSAPLHPLSPAACPRLVVKVGSALLIDGAGAVRREWLATLAADIAAARAAGQDVVVVSSGAVALGARRLGLAQGGRASLEDAQAAAAVGQPALAAAWGELLAAHGLATAQMLLTLEDLEDRRRYLNAAATLDRLLGLGVVPVVNENDSVATAEIRFGDNDRLAARVAQAAGAGAVLLLSDVDGLYTANPGRDPAAVRVPEVTRIDGAVRAMADGGSASGMGSGGMASKLEAARIALAAGAHLAIADGRRDHALRAHLAGGGTLFRAGPRQRARRAWLAGRLTARGRIAVDAGAAAALMRGQSLLAAGVTAADGRFARGDVVDLAGPDGALGRGLAEYDAEEVARLAGRRSTEHAALLGRPPRGCVVHRDHLVLFERE